MIAIDWPMLGVGIMTGAGTSALYFAGLGLGMRIALRRSYTTAVLFLSAALRIGLFLLVGWWVAGQGSAAIAGFALAFLAVRTGILVVARNPSTKGAKSWN